MAITTISGVLDAVASVLNKALDVQVLTCWALPENADKGWVNIHADQVGWPQPMDVEYIPQRDSVTVRTSTTVFIRVKFDAYGQHPQDLLMLLAMYMASRDGDDAMQQAGVCRMNYDGSNPNAEAEIGEISGQDEETIDEAQQNFVPHASMQEIFALELCYDTSDPVVQKVVYRINDGAYRTVPKT